MKKLLSLIITSVMVLTVFSGCNRESNMEKVDPDRTQIYAAVADVGMGSEWLYNLKYRFEKDYPQAQIMINILTTELDDGTVQKIIPSSTMDVFYTNVADFKTIDGIAMDITNWVTEKTYDADGNYVKGETAVNSLDDRLHIFPEYYKMFNMDSRTSGHKYLATPYYMAPYGSWYDVDLFENYGLMYLEGFGDETYRGVDGIEGTEDDMWGADGIEGTFDDGLPATFEDFKKFVGILYNEGLTPFTWSGLHAWMRSHYASAVHLNYEGVADYNLNFTFSGTDSQPEVGQIDRTNGYKLLYQNGRKAGLAMADLMAGNPSYYSDDAFKAAQSHLIAQQDFLGSVTRGGGEKRIAMLLDGAWWEYEAKSYMNNMAQNRGEQFDYGNRRFGYMPIPYFEANAEIGLPAQDHSRTVVFNRGSGSCGLVNKKVENEDAKKIQLVKDFILYSQSSESIKDFTRTTGSLRPVETHFTDEELKSFTYMTRQVYEIVNHPNTDLYVFNENSGLRSEAPALFSGWSWGTKDTNNKTYTEPFLAFAGSEITIVEYYDGMRVYKTKEQWQASIGN